MKKYFLMAVAALAMTACGGNNTAATEENVEGSEELNALIEQVNTAAEKIDDETAALIKKATEGTVTEEEKQTLIQKLKKIGTEVLVGDKTVEAGVDAAKAAVEGSQDEAKAIINEATNGGVEKVEEAAAKVEETKQKVEAVKEGANQLKGAIDALKKK